jgi:hypothetical protein
LYRKFLEHAHWPRDVPVAQVNDGKIEDTEAPPRHHLNEAAVAKQFGLHYRRKVADAGAG